MTASETALRPAWGRLPAAFRDGLAHRLGPIVDARVQLGGFTPGLATRLRLSDGDRVFVKSISDDHLLAEKYGPRPPPPAR